MFLDLVFYAAFLVSWPVCLFLLLDFFRRAAAEGRFSRGELLVPVLAAALALAASTLLAPRSGYDNEHDLALLAASVFPPDLKALFSFKEVSPFFPGLVSNLLTGYSLEAMLWKSRLLMAGSAVILFALFRLSGPGFAASLAAMSFFSFYPAALFSSSSFSSAAANVFLFVSALLAITDLCGARTPSARQAAFAGSSFFLVLGARYEFVPPLLLICAASALGIKGGSGNKWGRPARWVSGIFLAFSAAWAARLCSIAPSPFAQLGPVLAPLDNFLAQAGDRGFGLFLGHGRAAALLFAASAAAFSAAGAVLAGKDRRERVFFTGALLLWAVYSAAIYAPLGEYPLHFERHRLYLLVPFAFLAAYGFDGLEKVLSFLAKRPVPMGSPAALFLAVYAALCVRSSAALNGELRSNDRELAFLAAARSEWPGDRELLVYPCGDPMEPVLARYFPAHDPSLPRPGKELFIYGSVRNAVIPRGDPRYGEEDHYCHPAAAAAGPLTGETFGHRPYASWVAGEGAEGREVTIGFYRAGSSDAILLAARRGADALAGGKPREAVRLLRSEIERQPHCGLCRRDLALALLFSGERGPAMDEALYAARYFPSVADGGFMKYFLETANAPPGERRPPGAYLAPSQ